MNKLDFKSELISLRNRLFELIKDDRVYYHSAFYAYLNSVQFSLEQAISNFDYDFIQLDNEKADQNIG